MNSRLVAAACGVLAASAARTHRKQEATAKLIGGKPAFGSSTTDEWLVFFGPESTDADLKSFCDAQGSCSNIGHPDKGGVPFVALTSPEQALGTTVAAQGEGIQFLEPDTEVEDDPPVEEVEEVMIASTNWGLARVGVPGASATGKNVNIYVLDSGIRVSHRDFGGRAIPTLDATFRPPKECSPTDATCARDQRGHGTHCAGSAGSKTYGVAPQATLRAMQRGSSFGDAFASIDWVAVKGIRPAVVSMSFGGWGVNTGAGRAVDALTAAGVVATVAAGNHGRDSCGYTLGYIPSAITVGSSTSRDERSSFSGWGSCLDIFAPGSSILSTDYRGDSETSTKSGTSMATPHVAGGVALILQGSPNLSPAGVMQRLASDAFKGVISDVKGSPNLLLKVA